MIFSSKESSLQVSKFKLAESFFMAPLKLSSHLYRHGFKDAFPSINWIFMSFTWLFMIQCQRRRQTVSIEDT